MMKVVLINGSPNKEGCTYTGLSIIKEQLAENGVDSEIYQVGNKPI
jgi:multimeric flavodoxin WrbA